MVKIGWLLVLAQGLQACETLKPYEKEYLLSPVMDDAAVSGVAPSMMSSTSQRHEKLAAGAPGAGGGTSCPTCGG